LFWVSIFNLFKLYIGTDSVNYIHTTCSR